MKFLEKLDELNEYLQSDFFDKDQCRLNVDVHFYGNCYGWVLLTMDHISYDEDMSMNWDFDKSLLDESKWEKDEFPNIRNMDEALIYTLNSIKEFTTDAVNEGGISWLRKQMEEIY